MCSYNLFSSGNSDFESEIQFYNIGIVNKMSKSSSFKKKRKLERILQRDEKRRRVVFDLKVSERL